MLMCGSKDPREIDPQERNQLKAFTAFQSRLGAAEDEASRASNGDLDRAQRDGKEPQAVSTAPQTVDEEDVCDLHYVPNCQSCKRWDEAEQEGDDEELASEGLMGHSLTFAKDRLGKSLEWKRQNEKELVVIDPREREKEILGSKKRRG